MLERFGHTQAPILFSDSGFGMNIYKASAIKRTREEMFAFIDNFVELELEKISLPLLGNMTALMIDQGDIDATFAPIDKMKDALLVGFNREDEERHLLTFLHEFHATLDVAIQTYKDKHPRYLKSTDDQVYTNGKPLVSPEHERTIIDSNPTVKYLTYATGPIGEYFQAYIMKCYKRATVMLALSNEFGTTTYKNFSIEEFRRTAQVITGEIGGLTVENKAPSHPLYTVIHKQNVILPKDKSPFPIPYADIGSLTFRYTSNPNIEEAFILKNHGETALVAIIGSGAEPEKRIVRKGSVNFNTGEPTPGVARFNGPEGFSHITLQELPLPSPIAIQPATLRIGQTWTRKASDLFNDPNGYIDYYGYSPPDTTVASVTFDQNSNNFAVTGIARGNTSLQVIAYNPSGEEVATVPIIVR